MSLNLTSDTWIEVLDIKSAVKVKWVYFWESGAEVSVWQEMFLDSVVKLTTSNEKLKDQRAKFRILIETIVVYDGLSMRRMGSEDVRNKFRMEKQWKTSVKNRRTDINWEIAKQLIGIWMEVSGTALAWPIYSVGKALVNKWNWDIEWSDSHCFEANLVVKSSGEEVGWLKSVSEKWNWYVLQWDEDWEFDLDSSYIKGKPVLRNISQIDINNLEWRELWCRINMPISWLNSDTAKWVKIITETVVSILDDTGKKIRVARHYWELKWKYQYTTLLESTPFWISSQ